MISSVHPDVPIDLLTRALVAELGDGLVGLYAYGSAVSGGYEPGVSDIDLVAVTVDGAIALNLEALDRAHRAFVTRQPGWDGSVGFDDRSTRTAATRFVRSMADAVRSTDRSE